MDKLVTNGPLMLRDGATLSVTTADRTRTLCSSMKEFEIATFWLQVQRQIVQSVILVHVSTYTRPSIFSRKAQSYARSVD